MSRVDRLLEELSPGGVRHQELGEIGRLYNGLTGKSKADFSDGNARFVSYVNVFRNESVDLEDEVLVSVEEGERQNRVAAGDVLFTSSSENAEEVGLSSVVIVEPKTPLYLNSFCFGFRPTNPKILLPGFSRHLFRSPGVRRQIVRTASGVTRFNVSKSRFLGVRIPVPPLEVQQQIVAVLDTFAELEAELEAGLKAELEARQRQYAYYRGELFDFPPGGDVRWGPLREFCEFRRGTAITEKAAIPGAVPVVANGPTSTYSHTVSNRDGGTVVVARSGAYAGLVSYWDGPIFLTDAFSVHPRTAAATPRFIFHLLQGRQALLHGLKRGAGVPHVRVREVENYEVPVPQVDEQERIVAVLDEFSSLVNDLSVGLPAELVARRQQYEYYRDRLLTFEEVPA